MTRPKYRRSRLLTAYRILRDSQKRKERTTHGGHRLLPNRRVVKEFKTVISRLRDLGIHDPEQALQVQRRS